MTTTKLGLQQQPARVSNRQQQQSSGSSEFQPRHLQHEAQAQATKAGHAAAQSRIDSRHNPSQ